MKKYTILATILVLTVSVLTGCRRPMPEPTVSPATIPATTAETNPMTVPATAAPTEEIHGTDESIDTTADNTENGDTTNSEAATNDHAARSRTMR